MVFEDSGSWIDHWIKVTMLLQSVPTQKELAERLEQLSVVSRHSDGDELESGRLVTSMAHLEESFERYLKELLPSLLGASGEDVPDALQEIGEELRHIAWHMRDPRYFEVFIRNDA